MKYVAFFAVFLICVNLSLQLPQLVNCPSDYVPAKSIVNSCGVYTCDGTNISGIGCPSYFCAPGTDAGYRDQDDTKPYPDCCGGPICSDSAA